ncbi:MAG TPA: preprotein translocase subunit SecE [Fimbriiglobus sp.]|nr:preprotein translocase subunit SecE [Fimbriiglobus sp.]
MATAVQTSSEPRTPNPRTRLVLASVFGALYVIAGVAAAGYVVPRLLDPVLAPLGGSASFALRVVAQLAVAAAFVWLGSRLASTNPPRGVRGGIFLVISGIITIFFVTQAVGLNLEDSPLGKVITVAVLIGLLALFYRFLVSPRAERWMVGLEHQGWFHVFSYKKTQGVRARRYTMIGLLLVGWTGVYSAMAHETFGHGPWTLALPFDLGAITPLTDREYSVPLLLAVLVFWLSWRAVNMPTFADFLVATEAEMNKVSWSSRRRLVQDTIVVLVTCLLLTAFLLVVDLFWGWLLSRSFIGVLPPHSDTPGQAITERGKEANW